MEEAATAALTKGRSGMAEGYCATCCNTGEVDCYCGGDLCVCGGDNGDGTNVCPSCDGEPDRDDDDDPGAIDD